MTQESFEINLTYDNIDTYHLDHDVLEMRDGAGRLARLYQDSGTTGWFRINNTAKEILYPTTTAKPFEMDSTMEIGRAGGTGKFYLNVDGTPVHSVTFNSGSSPTTKTSAGITSSAVTSSTRDSEYKFYIEGSTRLLAFYYNTYTVKLYFNRYSTSAVAKNGIDSVSVSNSNPYYGDSVTYTANLHAGAHFVGWFTNSDCAGTPVSTSLSYTVNPDSDMVLYAYAKIMYIKQNGSWTPAKLYYKQNGVFRPCATDDIKDRITPSELVTTMQNLEPKLYLHTT